MSTFPLLYMKKANIVRTSLACTFLFLLMIAVKVGAFAPTSMGGPPDGVTTAPVDALVDRQLSEDLDSSTVNTTNVHLKINTGNVQGGTPTGSNLCTNVRMQGSDMIVCEHANLATNIWHTFTISTGVQTATGLALAADATYEFSTLDFGGGGEYVMPPSIDSTIPRPGNTLPINSKIRLYFNPGGSGTGTTMRTGGNG